MCKFMYLSEILFQNAKARLHLRFTKTKTPAVLPGFYDGADSEPSPKYYFI